MKTVQEYVDNPIVPVAVNHLKALKAHHQTLIPKLEYVKPFGSWLYDFLKSAYYNNEDKRLHPACLKIDSREFQAWNKEFMAGARLKLTDEQRADREAERQAANQRKEEAKYVEWCDGNDLDPEDARNRQAYGIGG